MYSLFNPTIAKGCGKHSERFDEQGKVLIGQSNSDMSIIDYAAKFPATAVRGDEPTAAGFFLSIRRIK